MWDLCKMVMLGYFIKLTFLNCAQSSLLTPLLMNAKSQIYFCSDIGCRNQVDYDTLTQHTMPSNDLFVVSNASLC